MLLLRKGKLSYRNCIRCLLCVFMYAGGVVNLKELILWPLYIHNHIITEFSYIMYYLFLLTHFSFYKHWI